MRWQQWSRKTGHPYGARGLRIFNKLLPIPMPPSSPLPAVPGTGVTRGGSCQSSPSFSLLQMTTSTAGQWSYLSFPEPELRISYIPLKYSKPHTSFCVHMSVPRFQGEMKSEDSAKPLALLTVSGTQCLSDAF